jgi:hypothetical protein
MLRSVYDQVLENLRAGGWTNLHVMTPIDTQLGAVSAPVCTLFDMMFGLAFLGLSSQRGPLRPHRVDTGLTGISENRLLP